MGIKRGAGRKGEGRREEERDSIFIFLKYFWGVGVERGWGYGLGKSLSGERNCLNFRPVNDIIGEQGLTLVPTFVVGRDSSGSQYGSGGCPKILPPVFARQLN